MSSTCHHNGLAAKLHDETASELVEFALLLPLLLLVSLGTIQLILFFSCYLGATYGSRVAVRYACVHGANSQKPCTGATITNIVSTYAKGIAANSLQATTTWSPDNTVGSTVSVKVTLSFSPRILAWGIHTFKASTTAGGIIVQ